MLVFFFENYSYSYGENLLIYCVLNPLGLRSLSQVLDHLGNWQSSTWSFLHFCVDGHTWSFLYFHIDIPTRLNICSFYLRGWFFSFLFFLKERARPQTQKQVLCMYVLQGDKESPSTTTMATFQSTCKSKFLILWLKLVIYLMLLSVLLKCRPMVLCLVCD